MSKNWKGILGVIFVVGLAASTMAAPVNRGGWTPPTGGWDIVWEGQHFASEGWIAAGGGNDPGPDGNQRTWGDNYNADDVTTLTVAGAGETEDGLNPAANAIVLQLQDNYTASTNGNGRKLKFGYPFPGTYNTAAAGTQRADNVINKEGGVTILIRFKVVPGTFSVGSGDPDGDTFVYNHDIIGGDASNGDNTATGDDDRFGISVGTQYARWSVDNDPLSTPILVGDLTNQFRTFWMVFEPGVNLDNWKATLYVDGSLTPIVPTMGGPGDMGLAGTQPPQNTTENWFEYVDPVVCTAGVGNYIEPQYWGHAYLIMGPGVTARTVTWQYDYVCAKRGAFRPTAAPTNPPTAPSGLTAAAISSTRIRLNWTDTSNNEDGFKIERKVGAGAFAQIDQLPANVNTYDDTTVLANTTYTYRVRAFNVPGDSGYSNEASATTPAQALGARDWELYTPK
jgi:hypothetical protein